MLMALLGVWIFFTHWSQDVWGECITESLIGWGWQGLLEAICSNPPAQAGTPRVGCPGGFWRSSVRETSQWLWFYAPEKVSTPAYPDGRGGWIANLEVVWKSYPWLFSLANHFLHFANHWGDEDHIDGTLATPVASIRCRYHRYYDSGMGKRRDSIKHLSIEVWCRYFLMFLLTLCSIQSLCAPIKEQPTIIWLFMRSLDLSTLKRNRTARESNGNKQYNMISRKNICFLLHLNSLWQYCWKHYFY